MKKQEMYVTFDKVNNPVGSLERGLITQKQEWTIQLQEKASYLQSSEDQPCTTIALSSKLETLWLWWHTHCNPFQQCLLPSDHNGLACYSPDY